MSEFKETRELYKWVSEFVGTSLGEAREVCQQMLDGETDIDAGNYRFIRADAIDDIMADELEGDEYMLGCFNADFLSSVTGWPQEMIEASQKAEAYEAIGKGIIAEGLTRELAEQYAAADGYGHHFSSYDGETHEHGDWYCFRTN